MNVRSIDGCDWFEVATGHRLRRATTVEALKISNTLRLLGNINPTAHVAWECDGVAGAVRNHLPPEQWRYFVLAFRGPNDKIWALSETFNLSRVEIELGFTVMTGGWGWQSDRFFQALQRAQYDGDFFVDVDVDDLREIATLHTQVSTACDSGDLDLRGLMRQLSDLKVLPHNSPLRLLGYFAILE